MSSPNWADCPRVGGALIRLAVVAFTSIRALEFPAGGHFVYAA